MAFSDREISTQDGQPAALYKLEFGDTIWRYTSADRKITLTEGVSEDAEDFDYLPIACSDEGMVQGGSSNNDMTVNIPSNLPIAELFRSTPPTNSIWLTVMRIHNGETDAPIYWTGTVGNVKRTDDAAKSVIIGRTLTSSFKRTGLRLCWTRGCPHTIYDQGCKKDMESMRVNATITAKTGTTITVDDSANAAGYFDGGMVAWPATVEGTLDRRSIESSVSDNVFTIFGSTDRIEVGMEVALYPGCDLTPETCDGKFDNLVNYGGFKQMSGKSPFDGTPVF